MRVEDGDINKANRLLNGILALNSMMKEWFENRQHQQKGELCWKLRSTHWRRLSKYEVSAKSVKARIKCTVFISYDKLGKRLSLFVNLRTWSIAYLPLRLCTHPFTVTPESILFHLLHSGSSLS